VISEPWWSSRLDVRIPRHFPLTVPILCVHFSSVLLLPSTLWALDVLNLFISRCESPKIIEAEPTLLRLCRLSLSLTLLNCPYFLHFSFFKLIPPRLKRRCPVFHSQPFSLDLLRPVALLLIYPGYGKEKFNVPTRLAYVFVSFYFHRSWEILSFFSSFFCSFSLFA